MQETDVALRTLVDRALAGFRSWRSAAPLAHEAGVGDKITYKLLARVASIGAITRHRGGGFSVTDTERLTMILAARRTLKPARHTTLEAAQALAGTVAQYAIGGTRAAAHHLGGPNTVATHGAAILYVPEGVDLDDLPAGDTALVMAAGARDLRCWADGFTSPAQTYADLFAQPGWQASEFRRALWKKWFAIDDWARAETAEV